MKKTLNAPADNNKTKGKNDMSYENMYAKKFVKLSNGVILPLILSGSNNCTTISYSTGREVLERHWWLFTGFLDKTGDELVAWAEERVKDKEPNSEWFKENSKWVTNETFVQWMKNCIKKASAIEEILEANPGVSLSAFLSLYDSSKKYGEEGYRKEELRSYFKTTKGIEEWIKEAKEVEKEWGEKGKVYYNFEFSTIKPLKTASVSKDITGPVICCVKKGKYLTEYNERSYSFCGDIKQALVFEDAETFIATTDLPERIHGYKLISAKAVEKERDKVFAIVVANGFYSGCFVQKLTSRSLHFTNHPESARRFGRKKDALDYIEEKLKGRFSNAKEFEVRKLEEAV